MNSCEQLTTKTADEEEDYKHLEVGLEEAQIKLKEVISSLNSLSLVGLPEKGQIGSRADNDRRTSIDFEAVFEENGLIESRKDCPVPAAVYLPLNSSECQDAPHRPDRPLTLSKPGQLPTCCNFKRQHWRLYVQGEFSYSSLPRHFKDAERELNSSYKDDLENIIKDLNAKEKVFEGDEVFPSINVPFADIVNRKRSASNDKHRNLKVSDERSAACDIQHTLIPFDMNRYEGSKPSYERCEHDSAICEGGSDQNEGLLSQEKSSVFAQNKCLMEDINKNCADIKNQLAILESVSEMLDRTQIDISVETRSNDYGESVHGLTSVLCRLTQEEDNLTRDKSLDASKNCYGSCKEAEKTQPAVVFETLQPAPSSQESLQKSDISSCSGTFSSPNKKLKSRKSRNCSLQRSCDDQLSVSERRSRTLSPSVTDGHDYKVSRATQTSHTPVISDCVQNMTDVHNADTPNGEIESHDRLPGIDNRPVAITEEDGHKSSVHLDAGLSKNTKSGHSVKQCQEITKVSPFLSQNRKSALKCSLSFSFRAKSHEKKKVALKEDSACSSEVTWPSAVPGDSIAETDRPCHNSESLLDKMHKKLYPYQYNRQSWKRSAEVAPGISTKKILEPSNSLPASGALPQAKSSLPPPRLHHSVSANPECSSHVMSQDMTDSSKTPSAIVKIPANEDTPSGDIASPSSGYSEMSSSSVKENSASPPCSSKPLCFPDALSPEQTTTSSSTPSPSNCTMSSSMNASKDENSASVEKNSKDILQLQAAEKKLVDVCEWLICAGFPQYVQLYREGQFPLALTSVESDHEFLDPNCLHILLQRITLLNRLMSMKKRLPLTSGTRDWYTGEMLFALSPNWNYDPHYHWWVRSDRTFVCNWTKSRGLLNNDHSLGHCRKSEILKGSSEVEGCTAVLPEVQDEASVHLTSGYGSETSPMSTSSLGHQKTLPPLSMCSASHPVLQSRNSVDHTVSDPYHLKQDVLNGNPEEVHGEFMGSSQETVKQVSSGSQSSFLGSQASVEEDRSVKNIPNNHKVRIPRVSYFDMAQVEIDVANHPLISPKMAHLCCSVNSSKLVKSLTNDSFISCDTENSPGAAEEKSRRSYYDNTLSRDPQAELDLILAELYRNIGCLDETLNNIVVEDADEVGDRLQLVTNTIIDEHSRDMSRLSDVTLKSENLDVNEKDSSENRGNFHDRKDFENYEDSKLCQFYQSKKAFLSIEDLVLLQKLCILKLTSIFEMHHALPKPEIVCPLRFRSSTTAQCEKDLRAAGGKIFGVSPVILLQKLGVPLPAAVTNAMEHLRTVACDSIGLFRKPGVQSRIQQLQNEIENDPCFHNFGSVDAYDLADVLKRYFRELPESLLSPQASQLLMTIFTDLPLELYLETVQAVMLLLSDVSRQVLHVLLQFLAAVADHSEENQMNASNLAVCFLPSFFRPEALSSSAAHVVDTKLSRQSSQVTEASDGSTSPVWDHRTAVSCICFLINNANSAFQIPDFIWTMLQVLRTVSEPGINFVTDFRSVNIPSFVQAAFDIFNFKDSEWVSYASKYEETKLSWHVVDDDRLLPMWCSTTAVEAPPGEVLARLKGEQHLWDNTLIKARIVERLSENTDIFHCVIQMDSQEAPREFCELRTWKCDNDRDLYVLAKTSVFHPSVPFTEVLRAITLVSHYLIEPCGAGKSRIMHVSRMDIRGHLLDWYYNVYGQLAEKHLHKLNKSFTPVTKNTSGPETNL